MKGGKTMPTQKQRLAKARKQSSALRKEVLSLRKAQNTTSNISAADEKKIKSEIQKLEAQKKGQGFFKKLAINKAIHDRTGILKTERSIVGLKQKKELLAIKASIAVEQSKLQEAKRKAFVTEEDIFGKKELFKL